MNRGHFWNGKSIPSVSGEEEIISTFQQFAKRMPLCLQWTASHVTIKNDGVLEPGPSSLVSRLSSEDSPALCHWKNHTAGFHRDMDPSLTLDSSSHHHTQAALLTPAERVTRTAVLLGHCCDTHSCPKGCWSWAQLIHCRRHTKQGAAASWKSSSTVWAGNL